MTERNRLLVVAVLGTVLALSVWVGVSAYAQTMTPHSYANRCGQMMGGIDMMDMHDGMMRDGWPETMPTECQAMMSQHNMDPEQCQSMMQ